MPWKTEMMRELQGLRDKLSAFRKETNDKMNLIDSKTKEREIIRKEVLLKVLKLTQRKLEDDEKKVISDLKSDAFDMFSRAMKLEDELKLMENDLSMAPEDDRSWRTEVISLQKKIEECNFEEFTDNLDLTVVPVSSETLNSVAEKATEVVQMKMPSYSPSSFSLVTSQAPIVNFDRSSSTSDSQQLGSEYFAVFIKSSEKRTLPIFLLKKMIISFRCQSGTLIEESSAWSKIENKRALVYPDGGTIKVMIKRPKNLACVVSVKLFNCHIFDSPQLQLFKDESAPEQVSHNMTVGAVGNQTGIEIFDNDTTHIALTTNDIGVQSRNRNLKLGDKLDLDDSDMRSLGLNDATRMRVQMELLNNKNLVNPPVVGSPHYFPMRRVAGDLNMLNGINGHGHIDPIVSGHEVAALSQPSDTSPFKPNMGQISTMKPTAASQLSDALDDMDTSELEDITNHKDANGHEDHELSIMDPNKKSTLSIDDAQKSLSSDGSVAVDECQHQDSKFERSVSFAPRTTVVSVLATPQVPAGGGRFVVSDADTKEADGQAGFHNVRRLSMDPVMAMAMDPEPQGLDNSATNPTPPTSVVSPNEHFDWGEDEVDGDKTMPLDEEEDVREGYVPAEGSSAQQIPAEDMYLSSPNLLNNTNWSEDLSSPDAGGDFSSQLLQEVGRFQAPSADKGLLYPSDITYVPSTDQFLVSEPSCDRVGIYKAETMEFAGWLPHPQFSSYIKPSAMLTTKNGYVFIIEKSRIQILDQFLQKFMWRKGSYTGLAEGPNGEVFTLFKHIENKQWHLHKEIIGNNGYYRGAGNIPLTCMRVVYTEQGSYHPFPSDLCYSNGKILITDQGLHKIYIVNLTTGTQSIIGYYGAGPGQFSSPSSIITDDVGNMMVADRDNRRLLLFNPLGQFVMVMDCGELQLPSSVQSIRIIRDHLYLVHRRYNENGGAIKCKLIKSK